jgi:Mor family transcriptional regulator
MNHCNIRQHVASALAASLKGGGRQESDVDELEANVLDEISVAFFSRRRHVRERRQKEETFGRRDVFKSVGKVDFDVGGRQFYLDFAPICKAQKYVFY